VRQPQKAPHAEAKKEPGACSGERTTAQEVVLAVLCSSFGRLYAQGSTALSGGRAACVGPFVCEGVCLVREPGAVILHARFDEKGVETE
jgi:hypothetical protein